MTRMTDLIHNSKTLVAIKPQAVAAVGSVAGEVIDTQGFYALLFQLALGAGGVEIEKIEEADDQAMANATEISKDAIIYDTVETVAVGGVKVANVIPNKRYVKITAKTTGANAVIGATAVLFGADIDGNVNL